MKNLILINGTMGVGKSMTGKALQSLLPNCAFLDGDWCWDARPWIVTDETRAMVMGNIAFLLNSFLSCSAYQNIVFCWVMHEQSILNAVLAALNTTNCQVHKFSLLCAEQALTTRLEKDIAAGLRDPDILARSLPRLANYAAMDTQKIDVTTLPAQAAAQCIRDIVCL